jgi:hypothetical protein
VLRQNFSTMRLHRQKIDDSPSTKLLRVRSIMKIQTCS